MEARRAKKFPVLDATARTTVGYNSTVYTYSRLKTSVHAILPKLTRTKYSMDPIIRRCKWV